ncbi:MAG: DNA polymerase III subunit gamma/tau [Candidatus Paceibacterota bacterium]
MSQLALYRKYRPTKFKEVLGQEHVTDVLEESIKEGNLSHSYLFFGSRGTGKTSVARILAREIGCEPEDLYEMDAASNRGIDDVRSLREAVGTHPFKSPYKVYIIDEVHMLTKEAFNALLKTLEEPPAHVVFVLATTEVDKVPDTVVSRCQTFTFKKPTQDILKKAITSVAKKEGYTIDAPSADLIALLGDSSFRDSLMILQKVLYGIAGKKITRDDIARVTSAPKSELVHGVLSALAEGNIEKGLGVVSSALDDQVDFKIFLKLILKKMRAVLLLRFAPEMGEKFVSEFSKEEVDFIKKLAKEGKRINSQALLAMLDAYSATDRAYLPQLPLELTLIESIKGREQDL